jgi:uncharacterized YccA/Bax inhibitor family protein
MSTTTAPQTSNPAFRFGGLKKVEEKAGSPAQEVTVGGTAAKTLVLVGIVCAVAAGVWAYAMPQILAGTLEAVLPFLWTCSVVGSLAGLAVAIYTIFVPTGSPVSAPIYAAFEGLVVGSVSVLLESVLPGIVVQAIALTLGILVVMLVLYGTGIIKVTESFRAGLCAIMGGLLIVYLIDLVLLFCGTRIPFIHEGGWAGIGFSLFVCVIAALNFAVDFDNVRVAREAHAPKWFEWYLGFGLLVTLIWLYLEILRLLAKSRSHVQGLFASKKTG